MKNVYYKFFFVLFFLSSGWLVAQGNLIYDKVNERKENGTEFKINNAVFSPSTKNETVLNEFLQPEKVSFLKYNLKIENLKDKNLAVEILIEDKWVTLDLMEVPESFYNYEVIYSNGNHHIGSRNYQRHYRGVIRNDPMSLVALSFFEHNIAGIISNKQGNYNIGLIQNSEQIIIYNDKNLKQNSSIQCYTLEDNLNEYKSKVVLPNLPENTANVDNCVTFHYETAYDMSQNIDRVEDYVTALHNQVAMLYENENITTSISHIKIWNIQDPMTNEGGVLNDFLYNFQKLFEPPNPSPLYGTFGILLTYKNLGGGMAGAINVTGICRNDVKERVAIATGLENEIQSFPNYSRGVKVVTHEFGHLMGSHHTHACVWGPNKNTQIDDCGNLSGGGICYDYQNPILPAEGGTIMSYCDGIPVGINFNLGFGLEPGNLIRNNVANADGCLDTCTVCHYDLILTVDVFEPEKHYKTGENSITAKNIIHNGAEANYDAGNLVILSPGFHAKSGSQFRAYIEGCMSGTTGVLKNQAEPINSYPYIDNSTIMQTAKKLLKIYPNPTNGYLTIESNKAIATWEISNQFGNIHNQGMVTKEDIHQVEINLSSFPTGIYFIKTIFKDGEMVMKNIIKK